MKKSFLLADNPTGMKRIQDEMLLRVAAGIAGSDVKAAFVRGGHGGER